MSGRGNEGGLSEGSAVVLDSGHIFFIPLWEGYEIQNLFTRSSMGSKMMCGGVSQLLYTRIVG